ncbi:hypothetical protein [Gemmobacter sp. 24YEA27]|uniref:hypothetical protein n=1 Tax=Gemmobacter sp. 24YEA27 TaxID=3040672 RepID=UPI0024B32EF4|nr:hypothetical protein [Gemmobacter sp. 24YEA27]
MKRRDILSLAPAAVLGCTIPVGACTLTLSETPIMALHRRYVDINDAARAYVHDEISGEGEGDAVERLFFREWDRVEDAITAIPPTTAQDMTAKTLVAHCHGDFTCLNYDTSPFWAEARALVGGDECAKPSTLSMN